MTRNRDTNDIKFLILILSKNFTLKTLSSNILVRFIHEVLCNVFIDSVILKTNKEKSLRKKFENIAFFTTMTTNKVHIYDETEKLTTRENVCWREKVETILQREKLVKNLYDKYQQKKITIMMNYRASIKEWILTCCTWKYTLTLNLFLTNKKSIMWSNDMTKKNLIDSTL
jgi:hypothetical protein